MRVLLVGVATLMALLLGSCGAAVGELENQLRDEFEKALPGGSSQVTSSPSAPSSSGSTVAPTSDTSIAAMLEKHNTLRRSLGLGALQADSTLSLVAQRQAAYNASIGTIAHEDASGGQCWDRADAAGYAWRNIGENLAMSTRPERIFNLWTDSPGHYKNMTNPVFTEIGLGKVVSGRAEYWCVVFARPQ